MAPSDVRPPPSQRTNRSTCKRVPVGTRPVTLGLDRWRDTLDLVTGDDERWYDEDRWRWYWFSACANAHRVYEPGVRTWVRTYLTLTAPDGGSSASADADTESEDDDEDPAECEDLSELGIYSIHEHSSARTITLPEDADEFEDATTVKQYSFEGEDCPLLIVAPLQV